MGVEIERKFLVEPGFVPQEDLIVATMNVQQAYICEDPNRIVRVRLSELVQSKTLICPQRQGTVTMKGRKVQGAAREYEWATPYEEAQEIMDTLARQETRIEKTRYILPVGYENLKYEVDVFKGALQGIVLAEVEVPDESYMFRSDIRLADWLRHDVTNDVRFTNSNMASASPSEIAKLVEMCRTGEYY